MWVCQWMNDFDFFLFSFFSICIPINLCKQIYLLYMRGSSKFLFHNTLHFFPVEILLLLDIFKSIFPTFLRSSALVLKHKTIQNHPQPAKTYPQPPKTTHNHQQLPKTTHNQIVWFYSSKKTIFPTGWGISENFSSVVKTLKRDRSQMFLTLGFPKIIADFTGKQLCWGLLNNVAALLKRDSNTGAFQ